MSLQTALVIMMHLGQDDEIRDYIDYHSVSFKQIKNSWVKRFVDKNW